MVWFAVETAAAARLHRARRHRARARRRARSRTAARRPTSCASSGSRDGAIWSEEAGPAGAPLVVLVHGSMDRSAGLLKLSRRLDDDAPRAALRPARLRPLGAARRAVRRSTSRSPTSSACSTAGRPSCSATATAATSPSPSPTGTPTWCAPSASTRRRCRGSTGGRARRPAPTPLATRGDPADAAERFMRRLIGDERWHRLPAATRAARRAEGAAMVGELADLRVARAVGPDAHRRCRPWRSTGTLGAAHHAASTAHLGEVLADCPVVDDRRRPPLRPEHPPRRRRRRDRRARQPSGDVDRDVAAEERARRVVDGAGRERRRRPRSAHVLHARPLPPHDGAERGEERRAASSLDDDGLDQPGAARRRARRRRRRWRATMSRTRVRARAPARPQTVGDGRAAGAYPRWP